MYKISFIAIIFAILVTINAASTHKHTKHLSKERTEDGAYSPRDARHMEGGEHHVEFDHEAIVGSVKEAEEYDSLSPEESKARLAIIVRKIDSNQDEFVDRHELKAWILRSFKKLAEEESNDRFLELDENDDGHVTWDEFFMSIYGDNSNEISEDSEEKKMMQDDQEMFKAADLDKNGMLSADEHILFQNPEEHPQMLPIILNQTIRDKDENRDGKIDFKEFVGQSGESNDKQWLLQEKIKFDEEYDKNNDGVLTNDEILSWIVPSNDEIAKEEVDHLFASTDSDHDDRLSYQEIIDKYDVFVGSEATDYGEQLHDSSHFADEL